MKKISIFAVLSTFCSMCFAAPSLRASSIPLNRQNNISVTNPTVSAAVVSTESASDSSVTTDARIPFLSPLSKNNQKYNYVPNTNSNIPSHTVNPSSSGGTNSNTDLSRLQQQIDEILTQQQRIEDNVRATVQNEIKNTDLTKNTSFQDVVADLQDKAPSIDTINETVERQVSDKLVEKGIVDNRGKLLVAKTEEIQPLTLSQKLENTLAIKFAKKDDVSPSKIASDIVTNADALQTLSSKVGTDEQEIKNIIVSDLKDRGILDETTEELKLATKDELPTGELQQQIDNLKTVQTNLVNNQLTREDIASTVETIDLTTANPKLQDKLSEIETANTGLQNSITNVQQQAQQISTNLGSNIDNKLKERGLIDQNNTVPFASKSEIEATTLAQKIANNSTAAATLSEKITPKESDIKNIIFADLKERQILDTDGALNVEKKGDIQVNETTVTNALRNSDNFKELVSDAVETKGYVTENELQKKNFLATDSDTFRGLATKTEITPRAIAVSIANNSDATAALSGKIGPDSKEVNNLIAEKLQNEGIVDEKGTLKVATKDEVSALDSKFVKPADITADKLEETLSNKFAKKGEVGTDPKEVNNLIAEKLQNEGILDEKGTLKVATKDEVYALDSKFVKPADITADKLEATLSETFAKKGEVGTDPKEVNNLIAEKLQNEGIVDEKGTLKVATKDEVSALDSKFVKPADITADKLETKLAGKFATKDDLPVLDENTINEALSKSTTLSGIIDNAVEGKGYLTSDSDTIKALATKNEITADELSSKLAGKFATSSDVTDLIAKDTTFAKKTDITADKLEETLSDKFAKKGEVGTDPKEVNNLIAEKLQNEGILDEKGTLKVATKDDVYALDSKFVKPADITADELSSKLAGKFTTSSDVTNLIAKDTTFAKKTDITADKLEETLSEKFAKKGEVAQIDDEVITNAIGNSNVIKNAVDSALENNTVFAKKSELTALDDKYAKPSDLTGFLTDSDLTASKLAVKLGNTYAKPSDLTAEKLSATLGKTYATPSDLTGFLTDSDLTASKLAGKLGSTYLTDSDLTASKLAGRLGNTYVKDSDLTAESLSGKLGTTYAKPSDLTGFAKTSDITADKLEATLSEKFAKKGEVAQIDDEVITNAIGNSNVIKNAVDSALENNTVFAKKSELTALDDKYAKPSDLTGFLTDSDLTASKLAGRLGNTYVKDSDLTAESLSGKLGTTYAKPSDLTGFLTDSDLTASKLASKLGSTYLTDSDLTASKLAGKLGNTYAKPSDLTAEKLSATLGKTYATPSDLTGFLTDSDLTASKLAGKLGSTYLTDSDLTASKLAGKLGGTYAKPSDLTAEKLSATLGKTYATPSDLTGFLTDSDLTASKLAGKLGNTYAKPSDLTAEKLSATLGKTYATPSDLTGFLTDSDLTAEKLSATLGKTYATPSDLTGFLTDSDLTASKLAGKLGNTYVKDSDLTAESLSGKLGTTYAKPSDLTGFAKTSDITADKLGETLAGKFTTSSDVTGLIANDKTLAKKTDITADKLGETLAGKFTTSSDVTGLIANDKTLAKKTDITADKLGETLAGKFTTSSDVTSLIASDTTLAKKTDITADALESKLTGKFTKSSDVNSLIVNDLKGRGILSNDSNATLQLLKTSDLDTKLSEKKVITESNIGSKLPNTVVRSDALPSNIITTGNLANSGIVTASNLETKLAEKNVITTSNLSNAAATAGLAKTSDVVTKNNLTTQLQSDSVKTALASAGFAKKTEVNDTLVTMADLSKLLNGGLIADSTGKIKIDTSTNNGSNIVSKLNAAKTTFSTIDTTNIAATSNIAQSVASVAASANSNVETADECNDREYMFWNTYAEEGKGRCEKCPDGSEFNKEGKTPNTRCICKSPNVLTYQDETYQCVKSNNPNDCEVGKGFYLNGQNCEKCPDNTEAIAEAPYCKCKEGLSFNNGQCTKINSNRCSEAELYWSEEKNECIACPKEAPFNSKLNTCECLQSEWGDGFAFDTQKGTCMKCPEDAEYNQETQTCTCSDGRSLIDWDHCE